MFKVLDLTIYNSLEPGTAVGKKGKKLDQFFSPFSPNADPMLLHFPLFYFIFFCEYVVKKRRFTLT